MVASGGSLTGLQLDVVSQSVSAVLRVSALLGILDGNEEMMSAAEVLAGVRKDEQASIPIPPFLPTSPIA